MASKVFERWLISITLMPTPGKESISSRACSNTGTGRTAGPALKLKILSVMISFLSRVRLLTNRQQAKFDDVRIRRLHLFEHVRGRRGFEVDAGDRRLRALEDDVLHLLHVD